MIARCFSTAKKLLNIVGSELAYEQTEYKVDGNAALFLEEHGFQLEEKRASVTLTKKIKRLGVRSHSTQGLRWAKKLRTKTRY